MDCLNDFIGIRGLCTDVTAGSGLYINDLPGMKLKSLEGLSDNETEDFRAIWDKIYGRAQENFITDVLAFMPENMKANQVVESAEFGRAKADETAVASTNEYKGIQIKAWGSSYLAVEIEQAQIYSNATANNVTIKIFDTLDGVELYTGDFDLVEGWNMVQINQTILARGDRFELFVCYDGNDLTSMETNPTSSEMVFSTARGAKVTVGTTPIEGNLSFESDTFGMILNWNTICSIEHFICRNKQRLKNALRYKAGIEYLIEVMMEDEVVSRQTLIPADQLQARMEQMESIYQQQMEKAMQNLEPIRDNVCFECNSSIKLVSTLPG